MRIAMIQLEAAAGDVERNMHRAFSLLEEAAHQSDLLVLPELWTVGYNFHDFSHHVLSLSDDVVQRISSLAKFHHVTIAAGTLPIMQEGAVRNTALLFGPDGRLQATYSKRHLFQGYLEGKLMQPGEDLMQTSIHGVQTGMAVCYELYFPKMWRKMAKSGTTLVLVPASWPKEHLLQWDILSQARAIENGICLCAVNITGTYHDTVLGGHSHFVDPLGHILADAGEGECICYADYDEEKYKNLGKHLSVVSGRVYGQCCGVKE